MVFKGKVEELGEEAQKFAITGSIEGLSNGALAEKLNEKYHADLSSETVRGFLKRNKNKSFQILKEDKKFDQKMAKHYFDTLTQLNQLNSEMWEFFLEIKKNPELKDKIIKCTKCGHRLVLQMQSYTLLIKAADHILKQIEHVDKVLGKMKDKNLTINFNYVDLSKKLMQVFPQIAIEMEKQGIIKIIKKKKLREMN